MLMKIEFNYGIDRDIENFTKTLNSVNSNEYTRFQKLFIKKYGTDFKEELIRQFIQERITSTDLTAKLAEIKKSWVDIQGNFIERAESIFGIKYPSLITVYLTTNQRCTYNIEQNYFFAYLNSKNTNLIIMHELLHFYTWQAFYNQLVEKGVSKEQYNDIKESLTELLNIEFPDLLNGSTDKGYPQHKEMRAKIRELWSKQKNLNNLVVSLINN